MAKRNVSMIFPTSFPIYVCSKNGLSSVTEGTNDKKVFFRMAILISLLYTWDFAV